MPASRPSDLYPSGWIVWWICWGVVALVFFGFCAFALFSSRESRRCLPPPRDCDIIELQDGTAIWACPLGKVRHA